MKLAPYFWGASCLENLKMLREKAFITVWVVVCGLLLFVLAPPLASEVFGPTNKLATLVAGTVITIVAVGVMSVWLWSPRGVHQLRARAFGFIGATLIAVSLGSVLLTTEDRAAASSIMLLGVILLCAAEVQRRRQIS